MRAAVVLVLGALAAAAGFELTSGTQHRRMVVAGGPGQAPDDGSSPLAEYPGMGADPVRDEQLFRAEHERREQLIVDCMGDAGFEYVATPFDGEPSLAATEQNEQIEAALPPERALAWNLALSGALDANDEHYLPDFDVPGQGGCIGRAHQELPGLYRMPPALAADLDRLRAEVRNAPQVAQALDGWERCMGSSVPPQVDEPGEVDGLLDQAARGEGPPVDEGAVTDAQSRCDPAVGAAEANAAAPLESDFVARHRPALDAHRARLEADWERYGIEIGG